MKRDSRDYLYDMLAYAEKARAFVDCLSAEEFEKDERTVLATARAIEIIGEAAAHIPAELRDLSPGIPWTRIVGMRNVLAHDYSGTNPRILFKPRARITRPLAAEPSVTL